MLYSRLLIQSLVASETVSKTHETVVSGTDEEAGVIGAFCGSCGGLEFAIEKIVEAFEQTNIRSAGYA